MFLGVSGTLDKYDKAEESFTIVLDENPLIDFVELPPEYEGALQFSNILCGVIRGALEMVHYYNKSNISYNSM